MQNSVISLIGTPNKELVKQDLSSYIKKANLSTRLDNIKKDSSKNSDSTT